MLMPLLSNMNPYDDDSVARFAREAAELVNLGIQSMGQVAWSTIAAQLSAIGNLLYYAMLASAIQLAGISRGLSISRPGGKSVISGLGVLLV